MAEQRTIAYRVNLGSLLTLHMERPANESVSLESPMGGPVQAVNLPGTVMRISAAYDVSSPINNLAVQRIARAFGLLSVEWVYDDQTTPQS